MEEKKIRLDTYLWAIRIFKSRSLAASVCKYGKVKLNNEPVKASHTVKIDEEYTIILSQGVKKIIKVISLLEKRQSAEIAKKHYQDNSPPPEKIEKLQSDFFTNNVIRERGTGRPTKKEVRDLKRIGFVD